MQDKIDHNDLSISICPAFRLICNVIEQCLGSYMKALQVKNRLKVLVIFLKKLSLFISDS